MSRDGKTIAAVTEGLSRYVTMPTDNLDQRSSGEGTFISLSPDGQFIAATHQDTWNLSVRNTRSGAELVRATRASSVARGRFGTPNGRRTAGASP